MRAIALADELTAFAKEIAGTGGRRPVDARVRGRICGLRLSISE
ncbi:hypothetical protein SAHL_13095 [Salinisphaera orenii YIM 95161]|uniref:Uncharacterized protein n=1 Tax=Salinisphaera orenii YIM 95161 TaxID=1051139 RepID=A0A423PL72_9GAMM|nr:hypothetical protein SAHL_13095 [Salinisphaera halophila YIM 95161]